MNASTIPVVKVIKPADLPRVLYGPQAGDLTLQKIVDRFYQQYGHYPEAVIDYHGQLMIEKPEGE